MVGFAGSFQRKRSRMSGKSVLSLVLCMTMVLGMLSGIRLTAKAYADPVVAVWDLESGAEEPLATFGSLTDAYTYMYEEGGDTIQLLQDLTIGVDPNKEEPEYPDLYVPQGMGLMLNGKTLTIDSGVFIYGEPENPIFVVEDEKGGTIVSNGNFVAEVYMMSGDAEAYVNEGGMAYSLYVFAGTANINGGFVHELCQFGGATVMTGGAIGNIEEEIGHTAIYDGTVTVNGGELYNIWQSGGALTVNGGTIAGGIYQDGGVLSVNDGTIDWIQQESGTATIAGGSIEGVSTDSHESNGLTLAIEGETKITDELYLGYYGTGAADFAAVTISGEPRIKELKADIDTDYWVDGDAGALGSLTITGGYFGNDPSDKSAVFAYIEDPNDALFGHLALAVSDIEAYNGQADWAADHDTYGYRIAGSNGTVDPVTYTVAFNTNGGTQIADQNVEANGTAVKPEDPTKNNCNFVDWYADEALTTPFDFSTPITADTTVYAKWDCEVEVEPQDETEATMKATEEVRALVEQIVAGNEVEGMDAALVGKINDAIADGKDIKVQVTSPKVAEADVQADADKIREKARETVGNDAVVAAFYDIDVNVLIDGALAGNVTKLGHKIPLRLAVPDDLPAVPAGFTRVFSVLKLHGGVASKLSANMNGIWCEFESDEFSTYALVYEDVKDGDDDDDDDDDAQTVTTTSTTAATTQNVVKSPKTGDQAPYSLWIAISCLGMAGLVSRRACRRE